MNRTLARMLMSVVMLLGLSTRPLAGPVPSGPVVARGEAPLAGGNVAAAKRQALESALRAAVEQGVGALVDSTTLVQNLALVQDKIYSASQGFVRSYRVLREGPSADGASYTVEVEATVDAAKLGNALDDVVAGRIHQQRHGLKRVMVVYRADTPTAPPRRDPAADALVQAMNRALSDAQFRVFDDEAMREVYRQIDARSGLSDQDLAGLAKDRGAEILVVTRLNQDEVVKGNYRAASVTAAFKAFDCSTALYLGSEEASEKTIASGPRGSDAFRDAARSAAVAAAKAPTVAMTKRIVDAQGQAETYGQTFHIVLLGVSEDDMDAAVDLLGGDARAKSVKELHREAGSVEIELLWADTDAGGLGRAIRKGMSDKGVKLKTKSQDGARLVFERDQG